MGVDLAGWSALVTGAASGIGRACAGRMARAGAAVTVLDLDGDAAKKVAGEVGGEAVQASNTICLAYGRTPLVENQIADQAKAHGISEDGVVEKIMLTEPAIKRLIEPEEVAELAPFLCTPQAPFITGASLTMDGGATAH